ncbi:unnamed protein product [Nyctereutes procyonoides]|uniref:(raccoon dog) hypothetical protein n=1 Tax=Nyctereutes procyonoides TaxID=34880 RepID=A0A811XSG1_NYCPR|nr:unnamed protein product [Nyctereutes procyonoides]
MKFNPFVTSDWSRNHKRHFNVPSHIYRKLMFSPLSKELRQKYNKLDGATVHVGTDPGKMVITGVKLYNDCKKIPEHKAKSHQVGKERSKYKEQLRRSRNIGISYMTLNKNCQNEKTIYIGEEMTFNRWMGKL